MTSPESLTIVGLMSGTSLDGISAAVVRFDGGSPVRPSFELLHFHLYSYDARERAEIAAVINGGDNNSICRLDFELGVLFAKAAREATAAAGLELRSVDAIASHGQTIWHVPGVATLQIGESAVIAELLDRPVISDFRVRDVAAGGQGAPLVPIADAMLFSAPDSWRALQNIGGIGNVTIVPPGGDVAGIKAFDTGPGVVVTDAVVERLTGGAERMDRDARYSRQGSAIDPVVSEILEMPFFAMNPPKSTGRELFDAAFVTRFITRCREVAPGASDNDIIATAVKLTSQSIAQAYSRFVSDPVGEVLISGGGARHPLLREQLAAQLAPMRVRDFSEVFFDAEAKEAVAFALLGYLYLTGRHGNVPGATGARGTRILGKFTPA